MFIGGTVCDSGIETVAVRIGFDLSEGRVIAAVAASFGMLKPAPNLVMLGNR
jgi:hypothetical protein